MSSVNRATLIGRLGKDPEVRYMPGGEAIANITLATSETWKDKSGEKQERTEWHRVSMFGRLGEIAGEYLKKGSLIYVEGRIQTRKWQDKDGQDRYTTEIVANEMKMLGPKPSGGGDAPYDENDKGGSIPRSTGQPMGSGSAAGTGTGPKKAKLDDFDDDIPF